MIKTKIKPLLYKVGFVPLSNTELRSWRHWWPDASIFEVLLMRQRNGGSLNIVKVRS